MRRVVKGVGWVLVILCAGMLCFDLVRTVVAGDLLITDLGTLWFEIHPTSLQQAEPAVARYLWPFLWHPIITTLLLLPAFAVIGVAGVLLVILGRGSGRGDGSLFGSA